MAALTTTTTKWVVISNAENVVEYYKTCILMLVLHSFPSPHSGVAQSLTRKRL